MKKRDSIQIERKEACRILGEQVKAARQRKGISLRLCGAQVGLAPSTISNLECGKTDNLDMDTEIRVRRWLGLPVSIGTLKGTGDTLADIKLVLDQDPSLDAGSKAALLELLTNTYRHLAKAAAV